MAERLAGKRAMVTGGASGFGLGIVECFLREGASVLIADIDEAAGRAVCEGLDGHGERLDFRRVDVISSEDVRQAVAACEARFGGLDVMVANAGLGQRPCDLEATEEADFDRQFAVNVKGVFHCAKHALPLFRRQGHGNIIVTASGIALRPRPKLVVYGASKGAVLVFAKGLAMELAGEGIRVNALCPAAGDTPMLREFMGGEEDPAARRRFQEGLPMGRLISPRDMGEAAVFLAAEAESGSITGHALPVDGGRCI